MPVYGFNDRTVAENLKRIALNGNAAGGYGIAPGYDRPLAVGKITTEATAMSGSTLGTGVATIQAVSDAGALSDHTDSVTIFSTSLVPVEVGAYVLLMRERVNGKWIISAVEGESEAGAAGSVFPINLTQTGGDAGSSSAACSFTYTVTHAITGDSLGTGVNPSSGDHQHDRPAIGKLVAATNGFAYYNSSGTLIITFVNEPLDPGTC